MSNNQTPASWQETLMLLIVPVIVFLIVACTCIHFYQEKFDRVPDEVLLNHSEIPSK